MSSLDKKLNMYRYITMKNKLAQLSLSIPLMLAASSAFAEKGVTFGSHLNTHGANELSNFFTILTIGGALVGFVIGLVCLFGMASIKMYPNSPVAQKFETAGMGGLFVGLILGGAMMAFGTIAYMFIATAGGSGADTSAFDKLKGSSIEYRITPKGQSLASLESTILKAA